jgi:long-chain fatty acid transport protein
VGRETKLFTLNVSPTLAYKLSPTLSIGVGAQAQFARGLFSFATGLPSGADTKFEGSGVAFGATAGLLWQPTSTTSIGLGWRSQMTQKLDGAYINTLGTSALGLRSVDASTTLELPNVITLSLRQAIAPNMRLLGTVEWSQWSRFKELRLKSDGSNLVLVPNTTTGGGPVTVSPGTVIGVLPADWSDGWFFALGGEYDLMRNLTVRAGGAYEISPVDEPRKRLIGIPDNNRIWASVGATYRWSASRSAASTSSARSMPRQTSSLSA